ncbi:hypothetical protein AAFN85_27130 [Mucilaginibacter sp. CAU 1740]|uniref:hypothetical protein n=1 Tax=Mucilaginibacter sp. CAU 1740 TaxID=3140365 RepID=UPI00325B0B27
MKQEMPFAFLLDELPKSIIVKPAVGMFYVYFGGKIVLIFRRTKKNPQHNGIWVSTRKEHHQSLKADVLAITNFDLEEGFDTSWLLLSDKHDDFEDAATKLCRLVNNRDQRIGKVTPASAALFD